jgi:hypothetical protein
MADTAKRLAGPTVLRNIHVSNETGSAATLTLSIGTDAAGKRLYTALSIPANSTLDWSGFIVLAAAEILQAFSGTASALTLTISGVETA